MVDLGVSITGAVGLAGIGGTILAARMTGTSQIAGLKLSISAENHPSRLAEKRTIYAALPPGCAPVFARGRTAPLPVTRAA